MNDEGYARMIRSIDRIMDEEDRLRRALALTLLGFGLGRPELSAKEFIRLGIVLSDCNKSISEALKMETPE